MDSDLYIYKDKKKMRCGYTTGSCAQAASKAASIMLFCKNKLDNIEIETPKGVKLNLKIYDVKIDKDFACCAVKKDSGDDPDVTNGMLIYSEIRKISDAKIPDLHGAYVKDNLFLSGGEGIGTVTKSGLKCEVSKAAINEMPRNMIFNEVLKVCEDNDYKGSLNITISIPGGDIVSRKTFNERLGIEGGLSILGSSGIIEPMSEKALIDTIKLEIKMLVEKGIDKIIVTPGNYGEIFAKENLHISMKDSVKCSNFVGETIDIASSLNIKELLFIAHIGKFIKVAGGIMNTHSKNADCRMEILAANAALTSLSDIAVLKRIMESKTTEEAVDILISNNIKNETMELVMDKIDFYLKKRADENLKIGVILFSNKHGILGMTSNAKHLIKSIDKESYERMKIYEK